jgi:DNA repair protein SbcC/Rad50
MRPIVLDMNGFASFREAVTVDFSDADFFALVGPTGSGKSTVIDAMTFALYGSVPRWGRKGMVSLALAPTTARGTVRLVFEVDGQRYVVARELRRMGSQVNQKAASLERLADPGGRGEPGEPPTEVLAKDLAGVTDAVERLLGLSYEDFCQCVVLPQGQFADFLHAKPNDRQEIMLRLLGAEHYRQMMVRANQRASDAAKRAETLEETLASFGDATAEAEDAARVNEAALAGLADRVDAAVPRINAAGAELAVAEADLARLEQDRAALAAVRIPGDVAALDAGLGAARAALGRARSAEDQAAEADTAARAALSGAPQRAPLELARQRRAERDRLAAAAPALQDELARLTGLCGQAEAAVTAAGAAVEGLRERRDAAARAAEAAGQRVHDLSASRAALASVAVPDGVAELDARRDAAIAAGRHALTALEAAEQADGDARAARDGGLQPGPLEAALRDARDLAELVGGRARARAGLDQARARRAAAEAALASAEADREQRQAGVDEARRAHVAAGLRPHLVAGEACPVCEQTVGTLPPPLDAPAIEDAQARLDEAVAAVAAAQAAARKAVAAEERAAAEFETLTGQRSRRIGSLTAARAGPLSRAGLTALAGLLADAAAPGPDDGAARSTAAAPGPDDGAARSMGRGEEAPGDGEAGRIAAAAAELEAALGARHALDEAANAAAAAVQAARSRAAAAQAELDRIQAETVTARAELRDARDPLVGLGAPAADADSLAAAWELLAGWAGRLAQQRATELAEAREAAQAAAGQRDKAQDQFGQAEADLAELRDESASAGKAEQEAKTRLGELTERIAELGALLGGAPDDAEITAQLALCDELEAAASGTGQRLLGARSARGDAERELGGLERAEAAAKSRLAAARDPLVGLGAPAPDAEGLLAGWTALQAWAAGEASARDRGIVSARERVTAAGTSVRELTGRLGADLAAGGVELAPEAVAPGAATAVARALERARAETRRIAERRAQAADLAARRDAAQDEQQVARLLGDLLRSDRFPRWLVTAALDTLVAEASVNLAGLTSDQFDLTHEDGEFYVIDHADADSRRSVRTLSGGETFQASLALALALSSQMSTLAAAGAARLDSIFLDEGFGTLDPETLEVVATTLETLAQGQRMVGVITHVAALAERVPVRFTVTRDARTSRVVREGPAGPPDLAVAAGPADLAAAAGAAGPAAAAGAAGPA